MEFGTEILSAKHILSAVEGAQRRKVRIFTAEAQRTQRREVSIKACSDLHELCVSVVKKNLENLTAEARRSQRKERNNLCELRVSVVSNSGSGEEVSLAKAQR